MFIYDFIKRLVPKIEKDTIVEDLGTTIKDLDNVVVPCYKQASDFFKTHKVKAKESELLFFTWKKNYQSKIPRQASIVGDIYMALANVRENADFTLKQVEELIGRDVVSQAMTAKKAILVRAADHMAFITRFATDLLNSLYNAEAAAAGKGGDSEAVDIPAYSKKRIQRDMLSFTQALSIYGADPKKYKESCVSVPEILINSDTVDIVASAYNKTDIDPLDGGLQSGFVGSPIYHIRTVFAEWQTKRYESAKDKKQILELRLLHLKNQMENTPSSAIEQQILYTQSRIDKYDRYLNDVEEDLGIK